VDLGRLRQLLDDGGRVAVREWMDGLELGRASPSQGTYRTTWRHTTRVQPEKWDVSHHVAAYDPGPAREVGRIAPRGGIRPGFELEAEGMLQARLTVITSGAPSAAEAGGRAIAATSTA
jgi:hypothetical protein